MSKLIQMLLLSKMAQTLMFSSVVVLLIVYGLHRYGILHWKISLLIVLVLLLLIWAYNLFLRGLGRRKASAFDKGLSRDADSAGAGGASARGAQKELTDRWRQAVVELKRAGMSLYDLPWYLLIGEPQSGKSTTLKKSGLEFPVGTEAISGAGGTRNCDWWFTNEAVILDTAGRFTFQEKNAPDQTEWKTFLQLLAQRRPRCPINGVLLVIPCTSLLGDNAEERERKAINIREKLNELQRELGIRFPVFVLLTKSDQMLGFTEFFSRLPAREQRQIFGWSKPGAFAEPFNPERFREVFDGVAERVHSLRLKLLAEDLAQSEVDKLYVFPEEFRAVREPLQEYLQTIFTRTQYLDPLFFRGFYFTSGLQEGKPIARACAAMLSAGGTRADELIENLAKAFESSKAFFIRDFYTEKAFKERTLIVHSEQQTVGRQRLAMAAIGASIVLCLITVGVLGWQLFNLREGVTKIEEYARSVHDRFIEADQEDAELSLEASLVAGREFIDKIGQEGISRKLNEPATRRAVRDMAILYFMRNVLRPQGAALHATIREHQREGEPVDPELYAQYADLWSVNQAWRRHSLEGAGPFEPRRAQPALQWDLPFLFDADGRRIEDAELMDSFTRQLAAVNELLAEDLDFSGTPWFDTDDPAPEDPGVRVGLVPGDPDPAENELLTAAIEGVSASARVTRDEVDDIVREIEQNIDSINRGLDDIAKDPYGCYGDYQQGQDEDDPAAEDLARLYENDIREGIEGLEAVLDERADQLRGLNFDREREREVLLERLAWRKAAVGRPGEALERLIAAHLETELAELEQDAETVGAVLRTNEEVKGFLDVQPGTLPRLQPGHVQLDEGMGLLVALVRDIHDAVGDAYLRKPRDPGEIDDLLDDWEAESDALEDALSWRNKFGGTDGGGDAESTGDAAYAPAWRLPDVAEAIDRVAARGRESIRVHGWIAYVLQDYPGTLLDRNEIGGAELSARPPRGATARALADALASYDELLSELDGYYGKLRTDHVCVGNEERMEEFIGRVRGDRRQNIRNFQDYWERAYAEWRPGQWLMRHTRWQDFVSDRYILDEYALWDDLSRELRRMVSEVGEYQEELGGELSRELKRIWDEEGLAEVGGGNSTLERDVRAFVQAVQSLPPTSIQAYEVYGAEGGDGPRLREQIERIGRRPKFRAYPRRVENLVNPGPLIDTEVVDVMLQVSTDLRGRFPFEPRRRSGFRGGDERAEQEPTPAAEFHSPQAPIERLSTFLFEEVPETVNSKSYQDQFARTQPAKREAFDQFFARSQAMRDYFFEGPGKPRPLKLLVRWPYFEQEIKDLDSKPTQISFVQAGEELAIMRSRTYESDELVRFTFTPGQSQRPRDQLSIVVLHESLSAVKQPQTLRLTGPFSIVAYAYTHGRASARGDVIGRFELPVLSDEAAEMYKLTWEISAEPPLPQLPDWDTVDEYLD